jgi:transposase-like protein
MLSASRDAAAATRFFRKALGAAHTVTPSTTVALAYNIAITCKILRQKYLMNKFLRRYHSEFLNPIFAKCNCSTRVITVDKNPAYPKALSELKVLSLAP